MLARRYGNDAVDVVMFLSTQRDLVMNPSRPDPLDFYNIPGGSTVWVEVVPVPSLSKAKAVAKEVLKAGAWVDDGSGQTLWEGTAAGANGRKNGAMGLRRKGGAGAMWSTGAAAAAAAAAAPTPMPFSSALVQAEEKDDDDGAVAGAGGGGGPPFRPKCEPDANPFRRPSGDEAAALAPFNKDSHNGPWSFVAIYPVPPAPLKPAEAFVRDDNKRVKEEGLGYELQVVVRMGVYSDGEAAVGPLLDTFTFAVAADLKFDLKNLRQRVIGQYKKQAVEILAYVDRQVHTHFTVHVMCCN